MNSKQIVIILVTLFVVNESSDITKDVFDSVPEGLIAAYGDFNSDELTDVFVIKNNFKTVEILFADDEKPLLRSGLTCDYENLKITSVVPGDFDGDAFMDVMITAIDKKTDKLNVFINWGGATYMNCSSEDSPIISDLNGEPLALDYNKDMIIDLFGLTKENHRTFWIFNKGREDPTTVIMKSNKKDEMQSPHAHAYLDLNKDFTADLFITTKEGFEIWYGYEHAEGFTYNQTIKLPLGNDDMIIGQTIFFDIELKGNMNFVIPVCFDRKCLNSTILIYAGNRFHDLQVNFKDPDNIQWGFVVPEKSQPYTSAITLRGGDFNMDGYPDLLVTLSHLYSHTQTFLLENIPCERTCGPLSRTFIVKWKALAPFMNGTVMGAFYDFYQDGILDVILTEKIGDKHKPVAFLNSLDYDSNFVKVIVLTGLKNKKNPAKLTPLGEKKCTYGTNLPGPRIEYKTTTPGGKPQHGASAQLPQSAYFSLNLPYTIFGLGRTPNFVDTLTVGLSNHSRVWTQLIPNSQMIVIPWPIEHPEKWKAQLFVTPSKLIWMSVIALGGTCVIIMFIIIGLYIKEKREDKIERLAERFHFDAM